MHLQENINLADLTTIQLGGTAQYFVAVETVDELQEALQHAQENNLRVHILGGGSNTVFPDGAFRALVIRINLLGVSYVDEESSMLVIAQAGEHWDALVLATIEKGLIGLESLSGIPGSVGATPIQNVGAYGHDVSELITEVRAIEKATGAEKIFAHDECGFGYRTSRFKTADAGKYIITEVTYRLRKNTTPRVTYAQLSQYILEEMSMAEIPAGKEGARIVREAVIELRKRKSMVIDPADPNSVSCGSFFTNPILDKETFMSVQEKAGTEVPHFECAGEYKVPAAWLIEHAGFKKGQTENGIGISGTHALALVNRGGTTAALKTFAQKIQAGVRNMFGIELQFEPNVVE